MKRFCRERVWMIFLPLTIVYWEILLKLWCFGKVPGNAIGITILFSLSAGFLLTAFCAIRPGKWQIGSTAVLLFAGYLLFGTQAVYYKVFKTFLALYSIGGAGNAFSSFWRETLSGLLHTLPVALPMLLPLVLFFLFWKKIFLPHYSAWKKWKMLALFFLLHLVALLTILENSTGVINPRSLYWDSYIPEHTMRYFGCLTNLRLDIKQLVFPSEPAASVPADTVGSNAKTDTDPKGTDAAADPKDAKYDANVLEIDWDSLIANESDPTMLEMHQYFSTKTPTLQNKYTGYFKGKNLIWIVAEGFSSWAVDKELTPTLYKMSQSGFRFQNFYNPLWYVSTSDGEFTTDLSLLPRSGVWSMSRSSKDYLPFAMGNLLRQQGYTCNAFHDGSLSYYDRNKSHPNLGYDFFADGAGLQLSKSWPTSDLEMMEQSIPMYADNTPFHTYYLTISGHMNYNFGGNNMAAKHKDAVADLPYSEGPRAYLACNIELDQAVSYLMDTLEEKGILDDTVIVLSGDHYPYGLTQSEIEELAGGDVEENFALYHSSLFIYNAAMEKPVDVDKDCCALDILPTLCNLFGLPYDSRLLMGQDILSDASPLVVFGNRSFITDQGRYNAATNSFTPAENSAADDSYAAAMLEQVNKMFQYSANIIDYDYYSRVLPQD